MIVPIDAAGRTRVVDVRRDGTAFVVTVDGRAHVADVHRQGTAWSLVIGTRSYEVSVVEALSGALTVYVDGQLVPVVVDPARARGRGGSRGTGGSAPGPQGIVAPMPGRIVKLLVKAGDVVVARQGLVVVEAMKMENELRSPKDGRVSEVRVREGASVEAGALLLTVE